MFGRLSLAIACVLVCGVCFASAPTNVTVTLTGPDEGWAGSPLSYSADVQYECSYGVVLVLQPRIL